LKPDNRSRVGVTSASLVVMLAINSLTLGGSTTELSVTDSSRYSAVMEGTCAPKFQSAVQYGSHSETK
jgi:hypothetical protein